MMRSLDSVTFDTSELEPREGRDGVRVWQTRAGDGLGLFYFPIPPDIPVGLDSIVAIRAACRRKALEAGGAIIEVDRLALDGCPTIREIIKIPQQPHGMTYMGSFILPFRDFSYVVRVECPERGVTGFREAVVANELLHAGVVTVDEAGFQGWMQDPYDPAATAPLARNRSENEEYDARFPDHPLSRLRSVLKRVEDTLRMTEELKQAPPFTPYSMAADTTPTDAAAYNFRGFAYAKSGKLDQAIADFNKALEINPRFGEAHSNRGNAYLNKGQYDQAIADYNKALESNPMDAEVYSCRGYAYAEKDQYDQAIADYNRTLEINPSNAVAYYNRGNAYRNKGQYAQAIGDYTKVLEINPKFADAYFGRGYVYATKGQLDEAIADYNEALEINPRFAVAYYNRGIAYRNKGQHDQSVADFSKATEIDPRLTEAYRKLSEPRKPWWKIW